MAASTAVPDVTHLRLWGRAVRIVDLAAQERRPGRRRPNPGQDVTWAVLEQQDADVVLLGEAGRENASGRSCADDHVVERGCHQNLRWLEPGAAASTRAGVAVRRRVASTSP